MLLGLSGGDWGDWGPTAIVAPAGQAEGGGHWWDGASHQAEGLVNGIGNGIHDGIAGPVQMVGGLIGLNGDTSDTSDNRSALGSGLAHGVIHPIDFGKALIGWDDLASGQYGHWAGELIPGAAAAFVTGGAGAALRGTKATEKVTEAAAAAERQALAARAAVGAAATERRVALWVGTKATIRQQAKKTTDGDFIHPNTQKVVPKEGSFDYGHSRNFEWWRTQERARAEGWTREQVIEYENDPSHYRVEDPSSNRSRKYELPRGALTK